MKPQTQGTLERQLQERLAQVQGGKLSPEQAFGTMEDWIIQLGERQAFLHPNLKQWMWYDRLHDEWVFAGCGVGEAILLSVGRSGGVKKLPQPDAVDQWCVYEQEQAFHGPLRLDELRKILEAQHMPKDILIWSTQATDWFSPTDETGQQIIFAKFRSGSERQS